LSEVDASLIPLFHKEAESVGWARLMDVLLSPDQRDVAHILKRQNPVNSMCEEDKKRQA
jgi:hypothetical protein